MRPSLESVRWVEQQAYPPHMQSLGDASSWQDVAEYCECSLKDLIVLGGTNWYALIARSGRTAEFVDIAKANREVQVPWDDVLDCLRTLRASGVRKVTFDARESTSYKLLSKLVSLVGGRIVKDTAWEWDGETMHEVIVRL